MTATDKPLRIIVVGGGAGGLELVSRLGARLKHSKGVEITLIDRNHTHIWKPLLHEVAAGTLNSSDDEMSYLAQGHWGHFKFHLGRLESVDRKQREVTIAPTLDDAGHEYIPRRTLPYDLSVSYTHLTLPTIYSV